MRVLIDDVTEVTFEQAKELEDQGKIRVSSGNGECINVKTVASVQLFVEDLENLLTEIDCLEDLYIVSKLCNKWRNRLGVSEPIFGWRYEETHE